MPSVNAAERLERIPVNRIHYKFLGIYGLGWLFDAASFGILAFALATLSQDPGWMLTSEQIGLIGSVGVVGMLFGAAGSGWLADRYGRKTVFQASFLMICICTFLNAFAWNFESFLAIRFIIGIAFGGEFPAVSSLLSEFIPRDARGRFIVLLESFWAWGTFVAAILSFFIIPAYGWQAVFIVTALPAFYVWYVRGRLPESPRWLESKGRLKEAEEVMRAFEDESSRNVGRSLLNVTRSATPKPEIAMKLGELWSGSYLRRTLMLWTLWFCLAFSYYGVFVWLPTLLVKSGFSIVDSFQYSLIIIIAQIPGYLAAAWLVERWGRKPTIVAFLIMCAITTYFYGHAGDVGSLLFFGCLMAFFDLGAYGAMYAYTPEQYPTRGRVVGVSSAYAVGKIGGVIAPAAIGFLLFSIGNSGVFIMNAVVLAVAALAVLVLGTETMGKRLEEIAR